MFLQIKIKIELPDVSCLLLSHVYSISHKRTCVVLGKPITDECNINDFGFASQRSCTRRNVQCPPNPHIAALHYTYP